MVNHCESLKKETPLLANVCDAVIGTDSNKIATLDKKYCYHSFKTGKPVLVCKEKDGRLDPHEFLTSIVGTNFYMDKNKAMLSVLEKFGMAPMWVIKDEATLKKLYEQKVRAKNVASLFDSVQKFLSNKVKYLFKVDIAKDADEILNNGEGNCVESAVVFHAVASFLVLNDSFYVRFANNWAMSHIFNGVKVGNKVKFFDPGKTDDTREEDIVYEATAEEAFVRIMVEKIRSSNESYTSQVEKLDEVSKWEPEDFFIPFNKGIVILAGGGDKKMAEDSFKRTLELNPFYLPAKVCLDDTSRCLEKLK